MARKQLHSTSSAEPGAAPAPLSRPRHRAKKAAAVEEHTSASAEPQAIDEHEEIARLAYSYWEARGRSGGSAEEDWLRAEHEYRSRRQDLL